MNQTQWNPIGAWPHEKEGAPYQFGAEDSYIAAAQFLADCNTVEDWGCGTTYAKRFFDPNKYLGVDGSRSKFCDLVDNLETRKSSPEGILLRHVLEHNFKWDVILRNALHCCTRKLVVVFFIGFAPETSMVWADGFPLFLFSKADLLKAIHPVVPQQELPSKDDLLWLFTK